MKFKLNRLATTTLITVALCAGILLGSVISLVPRQAEGQNTDQLADEYEQIYQDINPSVVNIQVTLPAAANAPQTNPPDPNQPQGPNTGAEGSGFVYDTLGHIVTNAHVVEDATQIIVTFSDDTQIKAKVTGVDVDADLAVIEIDPSAMPKVKPLTLADSDKIAVGQRAIAIGNPFGLTGSMTQGIVSAVGRSLLRQNTTTNQQGSYSIPQIIQTDAAINPGNSGGPLLNIDGAVIGITSAIESPLSQSSGVGFAIPSNLVKVVADTLIKDGKISHSLLGVSVKPLGLETNAQLNFDTTLRGALIVSVTKGSPADKAGLQATTYDKTGTKVINIGDVIVGIDGVDIRQPDDLISYLFIKTTPGQKVTLSILRNGQKQDVTVTLTARPASTASNPQ